MNKEIWHMHDDDKHPKVRVAGRVRGADGRWIEGAGVSVMSLLANGAHASGSAQTDRDGRFRATFSHYPPYQLRVQAEGYGNYSDRTQRFFRVGAGNDLGTITLPVADSFLAGRVVDEKGRPLVAQIWGYTTDNASQVAPTRTDRAGRFRVNGVLPNDRVGLGVRVGGDSCTWDNVPTGRGDVVLVYRAGKGQKYP
jgi:Carboxypeptidase regulatory-like domain